MAVAQDLQTESRLAACLRRAGSWRTAALTVCLLLGGCSSSGSIFTDDMLEQDYSGTAPGAQAVVRPVAAENTVSAVGPAAGPAVRPAAGFRIARTPEEADEELSKFGRHWFYGPGIGQTMANVGTAVVFPPYALYLLGNAGLTVAGYEPLYITSALPEAPRRYILQAYDGVTSVPGRLTSAVARERYDDTPAAPLIAAKTPVTPNNAESRDPVFTAADGGDARSEAQAKASAEEEL